MLKIVLPEIEGFSDSTEEFYTIPETVVRFEHSLVSLSKWEQKFEKPFLSSVEKTKEEIFYYFICMELDDQDPRDWLSRLTQKDVAQIVDYISKNMTATTIKETPSKKNGRILTSEVIYAQMVCLGIPFECQHWHLKNLFTLIRVCQIEMSPPKKMSSNEVLAQNQSLNRARLKQLKTKG